MYWDDGRTGPVKVRERVWVGIDVGKHAHHACVVDETGKVVLCIRVGRAIDTECQA